MRGKNMNLSSEQLRILENLAVSYDTWMQARRAVPATENRLAWKARGDKEYLYSVRNRRGDGTSLGPRSVETEKLFADYEAHRAAKDAASARADATRAAMGDTIRMYRALRLPVIDSMAGKVARAADERGLLGSALMVVGTNTMAVYEIEARERFATGVDSTNDFDMTWAAREKTAWAIKAGVEAPIIEMLKSIDDTFTVSTEKTFQVRNAESYEVEILIAPSIAASYPPRESIRPVPLPEQEWLLKGMPVAHVVLDRDALPAKIVAPDPRWMALHKRWLADKPGRSRLKVDKDRRQGELLWDAVKRTMPHYPIDDVFLGQLPPELRQYAQ